MKYRVSLLVTVIAGATACAEPTNAPLAPDLLLNLSAAEAGTLIGDVTPDAAFVSADPQVASACPGDVNDNYGVLFGHSGCLIVSPVGSSYSLTDDLIVG